MMTLKERLILASASPRRSELLDLVDISFEVLPSDFDESTIQLDDPKDFVETLAYKKAESIACIQKEPAYVLGADTSVVIDGEILGKPHTPEMTRAYLRKLSGKAHSVYTGVSLIRTRDNCTITKTMITEVVMDSLSEADIDFYISTKEPFDKAGGYGIQGIGSRFVKEIRGDYFNVVGLPINLVTHMLKEMGETHESITKKRTALRED